MIYSIFKMKVKTRPWRHIPRYWDPKTKKHDIEIPRPKKPRHRESETIKPRHRDPKAFFQRTKSHDIGIQKIMFENVSVISNGNYKAWCWNQACNLWQANKWLRKVKAFMRMFQYLKKVSGTSRNSSKISAVVVDRRK